jgi:hypothetical protein
VSGLTFDTGSLGSARCLLLRRREARVERHARDPGSCACEVERDRVEPVADEQPDAVCVVLEEDVRDPVRELVDLGECERAVAAEHGRAVAVVARTAADQLGREHTAIISLAPTYR